jgi:hypothetical protein
MEDSGGGFAYDGSISKEFATKNCLAADLT